MATLQHFEELTFFRGGATRADDSDQAERAWRLVFDTLPADHDEIITASGLPAIGALYKPGDTRNRRLKSLSVTELDAGLGFVVVGRYQRPTGDLTYTPDPLTRKDTIGGNFTTELREYQVDAEDTPTLDTAGSLLDPLPRRKGGTFGFTITGNRAFNTNLETYAQYLYPASAYNNASVTIRGRTFGAGVLLIAGMKFDEVVEGAYNYLRFTWELEINPEGWDTVNIPSRGLVERVSLGVWREIVRGEPPAPVSRPWPLDDDGAALTDLDGTPADVTLVPYFARDFSVFAWSASA